MSEIIPIKPWPFVMIGVPCGDRVHTQFMHSIWGLGRRYPGKQGVILGHSSMIVNARNQIVEGTQAFKEPSVDYLMFCDSDMTFPSDTIQRLLAHKKDVVCATYRRRGPPYDLLGHGPEGQVSGLVEMTHIPTGCLLIKMSVFEKFTKPYFRFEADEVAGMTHGEDFIFSRDARAKGFQLWCDLDLTNEIGHLLQYELKPETPIAKEAAHG